MVEFKEYENHVAIFKAALLSNPEDNVNLKKATFKKGLLIVFDTIMQPVELETTIGYEKYAFQTILQKDTSLEELAQQLAEGYVLWCYVHKYAVFNHYIDEFDKYTLCETPHVCFYLCRS